MIDDGPSSNQGGQMGPNSGYGMNSKQSFDEHPGRMDYNMPGILHFLQTEWAKFEMERAQWDVERAELQVSKLTKERLFKTLLTNTYLLLAALLTALQ